MNYENINKVIQPRSVKTKLKEHQLSSIYMMEERERTKKTKEINGIVYDSNIGIYADPTGSGKTISMLSVVQQDNMEWNIDEEYIHKNDIIYADGRVKREITQSYTKINTTLILVGHSIINQWYREIRNTELSAVIIKSNKDIDNVDASLYDIVLVTHTMYNNLLLKYKYYAWKRFIFDEPAHLKTKKLNTVMAGFYWLISATPYAIYSKIATCRTRTILRVLIEFNTYWDDVCSYFEHLLVRNDKDFIEQSMKMPETIHHYHKCYQPLYEAVNGLVVHDISRLISAGNISEVVRLLGGDKTSNISELIKKRKLEEIEDLNLSLELYIRRSNRNINNGNGWDRDIKRIKEKISVIEKQIDELDARFSKMLEGDCSICYDKLKNPVLEPGCQNIFCCECMWLWIASNPSCPLCRNSIELSDLIHIEHNANEDKRDVNKILSKKDLLVELINSKNDGKFIIFSEWDNTFTTISNVLNEMNISNSEVKGSVSKRENTIKSYINGDIKVLFLNSRNNGSGINLVETTDIIIYHDMSEHMITQVIGRANRLGRLKKLDVHHFGV